ncbi:MAG: hypothetical protein P8P74_14430 [Crocinitomicaceae bacterium]|nr:hypothetical protein [Crocinitomicaceae bacterium]
MDELDDDFTLTEDTSIIEKKRPAFLLVLCILTFIASGFGIIMGLINFSGFNDIESQFRNASVGSDPFSQGVFGSIDIEAMQKIQDFANLLSIFASILCLGGALIMFKMRKIGFLPYVLGQALAVYGSYVALSIFKEMADFMPMGMGDVLELTGAISMVVVVIFAIGFIIMYGVNLKHLK